MAEKKMIRRKEKKKNSNQIKIIKVLKHNHYKFKV